MKIATSREDVQGMADCLHEIDGFVTPIQDTLNIFNGMNYAQFLEAILRISYYKKDNSEQAGLHDGYKNTLEAMFAETDLDLKKRTLKDDVLSKVQELSRHSYFEENFHLFAAVYEQCATVKDEGYLEMAKSDFVKVLKDTEILIKPKPQKAGDDKKDKEKKEGDEQKNATQVQKFEEAEAYESISKIYCFDSDQMDYVDFLEAFVRISMVFPFTEAELADLVDFKSKMDYFKNKLEARFKDQKNSFERKMMNPQVEDMKFQPRVVVDEDEDDEYMDN